MTRQPPFVSLLRGLGTLLLLVALPVACSRPDTDGEPGSGEAADAAADRPQDAFLRNLAAQCGQAFPGRLVLEPEGDPMLTGTEELLVHFRDCEPDEIRIPFHVQVEATGEWNRSRTWYVMRTPEGLELRHDHREPDGAESRRTWYGGPTASAGTATRQDFVSAERTASAGTPVGWRIEIEPGRFYRYGTTRDGEYDWTIEFDLSRPVSGEIPPVWGAGTAPTRSPGPP
jgi:hypothetical protein